MIIMRPRSQDSDPVSEAIWDLLKLDSPAMMAERGTVAQRVLDDFMESVLLPIIRGRMARWLQVRVAPEDISQEAFVKLVRVLNTKREFAEIKGRLRRTFCLIAKRCVEDARRKEGALKRGGPNTVSGVDLSIVVDPVTVQVGKEFSLAVCSALAALIPVDRKILLDKTCYEKTFVEIARSLEMDYNAVRSRYEESKRIVAAELRLDA